MKIKVCKVHLRACLFLINKSAERTEEKTTNIKLPMERKMTIPKMAMSSLKKPDTQANKANKELYRNKGVGINIKRLCGEDFE